MGVLVRHWITLSLAIYFAGLALFVLQDDKDPFWVNYFGLMQAYLIGIGMTYNLKENKNWLDKGVIFFMVIFRWLYFAYYLIGYLIYDNISWMNGWVAFWVVFGTATFCSTIYAILKVWKRK